MFVRSLLTSLHTMVVTSVTRNHIGCCVIRLLVAVCVILSRNSLSADENTAVAGEDFFETHVRPLLMTRCIGCHGEEKQSGGLRLDSLNAMLKGGDSGPAMQPGDAESSRLIEAIRYRGDLQMPPETPLTDQERDILVHWVNSGAEWPEHSASLKSGVASAAQTHWAFQPVKRPPVPEITSAAGARVRNEIDAFVVEKHEQSGLSLSPEADRRTLIRRATYAVTGLPPTPEDVDAFVADSSPGSYERLIERLLSSPEYGQHWARRWLDIARYSDTKGYVYAREERFWVHAWNYRDWVINSLNADMAYDRFLLLQIAADQVADRTEDDLAAMGFLTVGRRFLGVRRDIIDDRIDVVTRGTMALTVGCARCHDHKYDPIPTADYYSLYGVFDSCVEKVVRLPSRGDRDDAFEADYEAKEKQLRDTLQQRRDATQNRLRSRIADYLAAQLELSRYPEEGFDQVISADDLLPSFVHRWRDYLQNAEKNGDPVFRAWHEFRTLKTEEFSRQSGQIVSSLQSLPQDQLNPRVRAVFDSIPESMQEVIARYAKLFENAEIRWTALAIDARARELVPPDVFPDPADEQLRQVLYGADGPCFVPDEPIVSTEYDFDSGVCTEMWKLQVEVDCSILNASSQPRFAVVLNDRRRLVTPRIFRRGNSANRGDEVPRQFLTLLSGSDRKPFQYGSGRKELAEAIIHSGNPLTARVIVNRIWAQYFGTGIVSTPGDFGVRAEAPSHPELLDWLSSQLVADGWSLKSLHRRILLSSTFRQNSFGSEDTSRRDLALTLDPSNRLLWRMAPHRLTFEELRDTMLALSGDLSRELGGRAADLFRQPFPTRRTIYGLVDRQFLPGTLRMFDFANPDLHIPQRSETTVPQQSLFLMNHPISLERARSLARVVAAENDSLSTQVTAMYRRAYQRLPSEGELQAAISLLQSESPPSERMPATVAAWSYGYGAIDEAAGRVSSFTSLPHFSGTAWQGGPSVPDETLGWVYLNSTGGHPGNDRQHASIRRWTAPRSMQIRVLSRLQHDPEPGDGIRAFLVSSKSGILQSATVHRKQLELKTDVLSVEPGETIDMLVDIGELLNSDQYDWRCAIEEVGPNPAKATRWDSESDFTRDIAIRLTPLEQLAQVLLCSNELMFID
ncbi:MAG: DUF1553 domain-containing protein [Planctomycetota bacterium]